MYDIAIIGGGPAGYVAAERAGQAGLKVILFEEKKLGGVCLNEGCIPTKTLLYSAKILDQAREAEKYGIGIQNPTIDFGKIMARKNKVVTKLVTGIGSKMKKYGVEVVSSRASIQASTPSEVTISTADATYNARNLLLATGSEAFVPPIPGLDRSQVLTNREILQLTEIPGSLTIVGGGVLGLEFASFFNSMGTRVTVIELLPEILTGIDTEVAAFVRDIYSKKGITFLTGAKVISFKGREVFYEQNGSTGSIASDQVLISVGRRPVTNGLGLEKAGILTEKGAVKIDTKCRTNQPNVYAAGDITGFSLLAHTASREGEVVINNLLGRKDTMRYNAIPGVVYTNPEISCVGLTEDQAKKQGIAYISKTLPMAYAGRFVAENEGKSGICKIIAGAKYQEVLGVHMVGNPSSEMIYGACMAIEMQMRLRDLEEVVFPHPTVSEILKETVFDFK